MLTVALLMGNGVDSNRWNVQIAIATRCALNDVQKVPIVQYKMCRPAYTARHSSNAGLVLLGPNISFVFKPSIHYPSGTGSAILSIAFVFGPARVLRQRTGKT